MYCPDNYTIINVELKLKQMLQLVNRNNCNLNQIESDSLLRCGRNFWHPHGRIIEIYDI